MDDYSAIFKRRSFHKFAEAEALTAEDVEGLEAFIRTLKPLEDRFHPVIRVMPLSATTCHNGGSHAVVFYDDKQGDYLRNVGYMGEQIDLYLASRNIGCCWFGLASPLEKTAEGKPYVILLSVGKVSEGDFREDMFKAARKPLEEKWTGDVLQGKDYSVAEIARYAPSACNTQPWFTESLDRKLTVYRMRKPGPDGIMPSSSGPDGNRHLRSPR